MDRIRSVPKRALAVVALMAATVAAIAPARAHADDIPVPVPLLLASVPQPVRPVGTLVLHVVLPATLAPTAYWVETTVRRDPFTSRAEYRSALTTWPDTRRNRLWDRTDLVTDLPRDTTGSIVIEVPITTDPVAPELTLRSPGVYGVRVFLLDRPGRELGQLRTILVREPEGPVNPLRVALVASLSSPEEFSTEGTPIIGPVSTSRVSAWATALADDTTTPVTVAVRGATLDALAGSALGSSVLATLRRAVSGRPVATLPYYAVDARRFAGPELEHLLERGRATTEAQLGVTSIGSVWLAGATTSDGTGPTGLPELDASLLPSLRSSGVSAIVVPDGALAAGDGSDPAGTVFQLATDGGDAAKFRAVAVDTGLSELATSSAVGVDAASSMLGEMAMIWLADPSTTRGVVIEPSEKWTPDASTISRLLELLRTSSMVRPVSVHTLFADVPDSLRATTSSAEAVSRVLAPLSKPAALPTNYSNRVGTAAADLASVATMTGTADSFAATSLTRLEVASALTVTDSERSSLVADIDAGIGDRLGSIEVMPPNKSSILSRNTVIRLRVVRHRDVPMTVELRFTGDKLAFPTGNSTVVVLNAPVTVVEVPVRVRTTGSTFLRIEMRTPDGRLTVGDPSKVEIRSLAVSGLGLLLSIGALVFLGYWWIRDWRRSRRRHRQGSVSRHPAGSSS